QSEIGRAALPRPAGQRDGHRRLLPKIVRDLEEAVKGAARVVDLDRNRQYPRRTRVAAEPGAHLERRGGSGGQCGSDARRQKAEGRKQKAEENHCPSPPAPWRMPRSRSIRSW